MPRSPYWTRQLVFDAFRNWEAEYGRLPKSEDWKKTQPDRQLKTHPTSRHVATMFGSWRAAIEEYECAKPKKRWKRWEREEIIEAIRAWSDDHGHPPSMADIKADRAEILPSMVSVKRHFPSLSDAIKAAGLQPAPVGLSYESIARFKPLPRRG